MGFWVLLGIGSGIIFPSWEESSVWGINRKKILVYYSEDDDWVQLCSELSVLHFEKCWSFFSLYTIHKHPFSESNLPKNTLSEPKNSGKVISITARRYMWIGESIHYYDPKRFFLKVQFFHSDSQSHTFNVLQFLSTAGWKNCRVHPPPVITYFGVVG